MEFFYETHKIEQNVTANATSRYLYYWHLHCIVDQLLLTHTTN